MLIGYSKLNSKLNLANSIKITMDGGSGPIFTLCFERKPSLSQVAFDSSSFVRV